MPLLIQSLTSYERYEGFHRQISVRKSALVTRGWGLVPLHTCTSLECEQWPLKGFSKANLRDAFGCDAASRNKSKARLMTNAETVKFHQTSRSQKQKKSNGDVIPTGFVNISSFLSGPGFRPGRRLLKGKVRNQWKRHVFLSQNDLWSGCTSVGFREAATNGRTEKDHSTKAEVLSYSKTKEVHRFRQPIGPNGAQTRNPWSQPHV